MCTDPSFHPAVLSLCHGHAYITRLELHDQEISASWGNEVIRPGYGCRVTCDV